jgi:hypothetical protein
MRIFPPFLVVVVGLVLLIPISAQTNAQIEARILGHVENLDKAAYRTGTGNMNALDKENRSLRAVLIRYGTRPTLLKYDFPRLAGKMQIVTSEDGKLRSYSWDDQEGGSGRLFETVYQYLDGSGKAHTWSVPADGEGVVCSGFVNQIFQIDVPQGRLYLLNSTTACSTSLAEQDLSLFKIEGAKLNSNLKLIKTKSGLTNSISFEYDFFSVVDHPERPVKLVFVDKKNREFRFPIVISDDKMPQGRVTDKYIRYRFNGKYFVKFG